MGHIVMTDEIQAPTEVTILRYTGKNPFAVVALIPRLIKDVMKITSVNIREHEIKWDVTVDPADFYGYWQGRRLEDNWSTTQIIIVAQGAQSRKEKTGWAEVRLKGTVRSEYTYNNFIQKSFWWFYNLMFYYKQRRRYIDYAQDNIFQIRESLQKSLGILREG